LQRTWLAIILCRAERLERPEHSRKLYVSKFRTINPRKLQALPDNKQQDVLALVDELLKEIQEPSSSTNVRPIREIFKEIGEQAAPGTWDDANRWLGQP
jgi:hypothetical protein